MNPPINIPIQNSILACIMLVILYMVSCIMGNNNGQTLSDYMQKSTYDKDNNDIVDDVDAVDGGSFS
jgi:hypothetical protein